VAGYTLHHKLTNMLAAAFDPRYTEAGCDEAGRGCLAGPVVAAAVILPKDFYHPLLNDSKQLTHAQRTMLRPIIESESLAWAVSSCDNHEIDSINILNASILAMHRAIEKLSLVPELLLIDGNRFKAYPGIAHVCVVKGDAKFASIAAASVLAKTHRDELMVELHDQFPQYNWLSNKGYPTEEHRKALLEHGSTSLHRATFTLKSKS
jgi:ribonuclease HII